MPFSKTISYTIIYKMWRGPMELDVTYTAQYDRALQWACTRTMSTVHLRQT